MSNETLISAIEYYMDNGEGILGFFFPPSIHSCVEVECGEEYVIDDNLFITKINGTHIVIILDKVTHLKYYETKNEGKNE